MSDLLKEYFSLTNNEQRGIISLVLIILFVFIAPRLYLLHRPEREIVQDNSEILAQFMVSDDKALKAETELVKTYKLFSFDPNLANKEELLALGIKESVTSTLLNYRSKGGKFFTPEDLLKIYGMKEETYNQLKPYIQIQAKKTPKKEWVNYEEKPIQVKKSSYTPKPEKVFIPIEVNAADSALLTTVKGIGPVYASRIIKYRNLLGGYQSKEQLLEVYGIDEEVYAGISGQLEISPSINPIKVNAATWKELKSHPYISGDLANIILNYIKAHGQLNDLSALLEHSLIDEETLLKITPYLSFEE